MADFVGPKSWLVFDRLKLNEGYLDWILEESRRIRANGCAKSKYQSYIEFRDLILKLNCTNDKAKRNIKLLSPPG